MQILIRKNPSTDFGFLSSTVCIWRPAQHGHALTRRRHISGRGDKETNSAIEGVLSFNEKLIRFADENFIYLTEIGVCKVKGGQLLITVSCNVPLRLLKTRLMSEHKIRAIEIQLYRPIKLCKDIKNAQKPAGKCIFWERKTGDRPADLNSGYFLSTLWKSKCNVPSI